MVLIFVLRIFPFKVCNTARIMPIFGEQFIFINFNSMVLRWITLLRWEVIFLRFLVNLSISVYAFCTKICDSIKNYIHHEKRIRIRRLMMVILCKHFFKETIGLFDQYFKWYLFNQVWQTSNRFYGKLLSIRTLTTDPNNKT